MWCPSQFISWLRFFLPGGETTRFCQSFWTNPDEGFWGWSAKHGKKYGVFFGKARHRHTFHHVFRLGNYYFIKYCHQTLFFGVKHKPIPWAPHLLLLPRQCLFHSFLVRSEYAIPTTTTWLLPSSPWPIVLALIFLAAERELLISRRFIVQCWSSLHRDASSARSWWPVA